MEVRKEFLLLFVFYLVPTDLSMYIFHCWALLVCDMQKNLRFSNMSTFTQEFEQVEEELPNTILRQGSNGSTTLGDGTNGFTPNPRRLKKKRSHPGNPDPNAEVIALSPRTLMATNTYVCEVCHKGFQRDQNLQLHRRGHNLPWKLKQKQSMEVRKRVYICPEKSCVHHALNRALGDLTGIKKHFFRKHGEKKWKCDKCSKRYAVHSDWKAHLKICGTKEYRCDCGTIFSRKDSFVTHRAFCDALTEENYKVSHTLVSVGGMLQSQTQELFSSSVLVPNSCSNMDTMMSLAISKQNANAPIRSFSLGSSGVTFSSCSDGVFDPNMPKALSVGLHCPSGSFDTHTAISLSCMSATALLQKAAEMGAKVSDNLSSQILPKGFTGYSSSTMSSKGPALEASSVIDHTTNSDPYVRNQNLIEQILEESRSMSVMPGSAVLKCGFMDFPEHSNIGETAKPPQRVFMGGSAKMTVDFLGAEQAGHHISEKGVGAVTSALLG